MSNLFSRAQISVTGTIGSVKLEEHNDKKVLKFSLVTVDRYKEKGDWQEAIIWHNVIIWNPFPFYIDNIVKGAKGVTVDGRLCGKNYTDKATNTARVYQQIEANNGGVIFSNYTKDSTKNTPENTGAKSSNPDDDLPF